MSEWQSIDTAPRDGKCILLHGGGVPIAGAWDSDTRKWYDWRSGETLWYMDYWMPLPPPPTQED